MAFCGNCGNKIEYGDKFCPMCGTLQEVNMSMANATNNTAYNTQGRVAAQGGNMNAVGTPNNMSYASDNTGFSIQGIASKFKMTSKQLILVFSAVVAMFVGVLVLLICLMAKSHTLELEAFYEPKFTGYDTVGRFQSWEKKDSEGIAIEIMNSNKSISLSDAQKMSRSIKVELEKDKDLSNGEEVKVIVRTTDPSIFEENNINLDTDGWNIKVSGLEELKEIDPFSEDYMKVDIIGVSPFISLNAYCINVGELGWIDYKCDKYQNLKEGDVINISLTDEEERLREKGFKLKNTTYQYVISGMIKYIDNVEDINESVLNRMQEEVISKMNALVTDSYHKDKMVVSDVTYRGTILLMSKAARSSGNNRVCVIYSATVSDPREEAYYEPTTVYYSLEFNDLMQDGNGLQNYSERVGNIPIDGSFSINIALYSYSGGYIDANKLYYDFAQTKLSEYDCTMTDGLKALLN